MAKYRVIKEMPGYEVGNIIESGYCHLIITSKSEYSFANAVEDGWIEEVKEYSLEDKLDNYLRRYIGFSGCVYVSKIAKDHFKQHPEELGLVSKERVLEVFLDTYQKSLGENAGYGWKVLENIRKALNDEL